MPLLIWEVATAYLVEVPLLIWEVATAYLFLLHNHATSWSNLQDCKISSRAEIPKLDRVWQKLSPASFIRVWYSKAMLKHKTKIPQPHCRK